MQNPNRSISATLCNLRSKSYNSSIGDYPLLYTIVETILELSFKPSRFQVNYALNKSEELKQFSKSDKKELLNQLVKPVYVQKKTAKKLQGMTKMEKMNSLSF